MKYFIDSADLDEIKEALSWGIVDGITTNPSLIKKAIIKKAIAEKNIEMKQHIINILTVTREKPVSLEVDGELNGNIRGSQMIAEAKILHQTFQKHNLNLNIKIPINPAILPEDIHQFEGLNAIYQLRLKNISINATLIMTPEQAVLAAKAGAKYVSPFIGRIDDHLNGREKSEGINNGIDLIRKTMIILKNYKFQTEVIAASIRSIEHVRQLELLGQEGLSPHIATIPFSVLKQMISHPKTYEGVQKFKEDVVPEYRAILRKVEACPE